MTNNHQNYSENNIHSEELLLERRNNEPQSVVVLKLIASYSLIFAHPDQFLVDRCGGGVKRVGAGCFHPAGVRVYLGVAAIG